MTIEATLKAARYEGLFHTPLIIIDLPDPGALLDGLKSAIATHRAAHATVGRSNQGGWQSDTRMLRWAGEPAVELANVVAHMCARYTRDVGQTHPSHPRFEWGVEMWANVCPPGVGNESHTHPGALWSLVCYVDDGLADGELPEQAGQVVLRDPRNPLPLAYKPDLRFANPDGSTYRSDHRLTPKAGRIIGFPAWLSHWVTPHRGSRDRISIAMNTLAVELRRDR